MKRAKADTATAPIGEPTILARIQADIKKLNETVSKLSAADAELAREDVSLQQKRAPNRDEALRNEAVALLDGPSAEKPAKSPSTRLQEIAFERAKIAHALEIADGRMTRLMFDRIVEQRKLIADAWAEKQRERALCVAQLQRLNREAQKMLSTVIDPHGFIDMPAAYAQRPAGRFLGGNGAEKSGDFGEFLELVVNLGIVTKGELEKA